MNEVLDKDVIVCGIASEFCVKETVEDLIRNGFNVELYIDG
ncbi:isochorismatase family protein [Clostridium botulinum]|nr:isochorismatase family protein [Clostridium botulinum]